MIEAKSEILLCKCVFAIYLLCAASFKDVLNVKVHLKIVQKSGRFPAHREAFETESSLFASMIKTDEICMGDKCKNKPKNGCKTFEGRGTVDRVEAAREKGRVAKGVSAVVSRLRVGTYCNVAADGYIRGAHDRTPLDLLAANRQRARMAQRPPVTVPPIDAGSSELAQTVLRHKPKAAESDKLKKGQPASPPKEV